MMQWQHMQACRQVMLLLLLLLLGHRQGSTCQAGSGQGTATVSDKCIIRLENPVEVAEMQHGHHVLGCAVPISSDLNDRMNFMPASGSLTVYVF
jgi:hypothetical protein